MQIFNLKKEEIKKEENKKGNGRRWEEEKGYGVPKVG